MTFEKLEYFYTLATYLNYTKASERLFISQPSLSKQIMQLEKELGVKLFKRNKHKVSLTQEGEECLNIIFPLLNNYHKLLKWAKDVQENNASPSLCIGYYGTLLRDIVLALVDGFMEKYPSLDISIKNFSPHNTAMALENGLVDLAILRDTYCSDLTEVNQEKLCTIRQFLIVPTNHPFADRKLVSLNELTTYPFIDLYQKDSPQGHDDMIRLCHKYGLNPNIRYSCDDANSYYMMIRSGRGIGIAHAFSNSVVPGLKYIALDCADCDLDSDIMAVWKKNHSLSSKDLFPHILREISSSFS